MLVVLPKYQQLKRDMQMSLLLVEVEADEIDDELMYELDEVDEVDDV